MPTGKDVRALDPDCAATVHYSAGWDLQPPASQNETAALNGMRVLSMFWIILGHTFLMAQVRHTVLAGVQYLA